MKSKEWATINLLAYLEANNLLVCQLPETETAEIYEAASKLLGRPVLYSASHTHYIMQGGDVVHIGNQYTCERFTCIEAE